MINWLLENPKWVFLAIGIVIGVIACVAFACLKGGIFDDFD